MCSRRRADNLEELRRENRAGLLAVDLFDMVDARAARWRLFQRSDANYMYVGCDRVVSNLRMVLIEHVWPMNAETASERASFHKDMLQSLINQFPDAMICMVVRRGGLGCSDSLIRSLRHLRKRKVLCKPCRNHYVPLTLTEDGYVPITCGDTSDAIVVMPHGPADIWLHCHLRPLVADVDEVYIPHVCHAVFVGGYSVLQLAAYSCESALAIVKFHCRQHVGPACGEVPLPRWCPPRPVRDPPKPVPRPVEVIPPMPTRPPPK